MTPEREMLERTNDHGRKISRLITDMAKTEQRVQGLEIRVRELAEQNRRLEAFISDALDDESKPPALPEHVEKLKAILRASGYFDRQTQPEPK